MIKLVSNFLLLSKIVKQSNPSILKKAIDQGRFGKINMVHLNVFWTRPQVIMIKLNGEEHGN